jgi:hypothetical protein
MVSLQELDVDGLAISGTLPPALSAWKMVYFSLAHTRISGTIPPEYSVWPMTAFRISAARVSGTVPASLADWGPWINGYFVLSSTSVSGTLPESFFFSWSLIDYLDVSRNEITGTLPSMTNMSLLRGGSPASPRRARVSLLTGALTAVFDISGTRLSGTLYGTGLTSLQYIFASESRFAAVDNSLLQLPNLRLAKLDGNQLAFSPSRCPPNITVDVVDLSRNPWQGVTADAAVRCIINGGGTTTETLFLDGMGLVGTLSPLNASRTLRSLTLDGNRVSLTFPSERLGHDYRSNEISVWDRLHMAGNDGPAVLLDDIASFSIISNINVSYLKATFCYDGAFFYNPQLETATLLGIRASANCKSSVMDELLEAQFASCSTRPPDSPYVLPQIFCQLANKVGVSALPPAGAPCDCPDV